MATGSDDEPARRYVSRAGVKLAHALTTFDVSVTDKSCADLGCHAGGFVDCLLKHGAASVVAVDTGYGVLDYTLRRDPRVTVMERTNALHADPPDGPVAIVTIDLGWTPQARAIPAALRWLEPKGRIVSLVKPHYELTADEKVTQLIDGVLTHADAEAAFERVVEKLPRLGVEVLSSTTSPIGGAKSARRGGSGNREYLLLLRAAAE